MRRCVEYACVGIAFAAFHILYTSCSGGGGGGGAALIAEADSPALLARVAELESDSRRLGGEISQLANYFDAFKANTENRLHQAESAVLTREQQTMLRHIRLLTFEEERAIGPGVRTIQISGVNVQIVNGLGDTYSKNGAGNVFLGYHRQPQSGSSFRRGSHNLVIGDAHSHEASGGLVAGFNNTISGASSCVVGGCFNVASGTCASVSGGNSNTAKGENSSVGGGAINMAEGTESCVSGGVRRTARGESDWVAGALLQDL